MSPPRTRNGVSMDYRRRCVGLGIVLRAAVILSLGGCAAGAEPSSATPQGVAVAPPPASPGHYDYSGIKSIRVNGQVMTPEAALDASNRAFAAQVAQIAIEGKPIAKSVRIVLPDHDRLRPLAAQALKRPGGGAVEFFAERDRLALHELADVLAHSQLFSSTAIVEQNDTVAPDPAGADYLIWFQVRSVAPNNVGPWIGRWQMRQAHGVGVDPIGLDPGTPVGVPRLESFVTSVRLAAAHLSGGAVVANPGEPTRARGNGSGIVVDAAGHVLTNNHVVATCPELHVVDTNGNSDSATVIAADAANDLALLRTGRRRSSWANFRDSRGLKPGEPLVVTGFPLSGVVSSEMAVTTGSLTALAGLRGDTRQLELSAPVQPGNSGGPVLDETGSVVGVTVSMLNGLAIAAATGALPQNVNFAIKTTTAREFLDANQIAMDQAAGRQAMSAAAVGALARRFTVKVECWR